MFTLRSVAFLIVLAVCALCACVADAIPAWAVPPPIVNGNLARGAGDEVYGWYAAAKHRKQSDFSWYRTDTGGQISIKNQAANYASWHQVMMLRPGWYRLSAMARVDGVRPDGPGATIAVQTFRGQRLPSNALHGTTGWEPIVLYLRVERWGQITEIMCQLGEDKDLETGRAWFRAIEVTPISAPPAAASNIYDLSTIAMAQVPPAQTIDYQRPLGVACGALLVGLLGYCLAAIWRPALARLSPGVIAGVFVMLVILIVEFGALFSFEGYFWDIWAKTNRALLAVALGPREIYTPGLPVDSYPPGSLYLLWLSGWLGRVIEPSYAAFRVLVESPPVVASFLIGLTLLFASARDSRGWHAFVVMLLFAINPALIFDTVIWGQSDAVVALAMLASAILIVMGKWRLGWIAAGLAFLIKPQAVAMIPPLGLWTLINAGLAETAICAALTVATFALGILPFQAGHPLNWMVAVYRDLGGRFTDASVGAFNLHAMLGGLETPDATHVAIVSYYALGMSALIGAFAVVVFLVWRARSATAVMLATFIAMFAFFLFAPRMHERYVYYPLVFLVPLALESRFFAAAFAILTGTSFFNLYFMKYLTDSSSFFSSHAGWPVGIASAINLLLFTAIVAYALFRIPLRDRLEGPFATSL